MTLERLTQITSVGITSGITLNSATLTGVTTLTTASASGNISAVDGTFSGDLNVAGTLTYEDVSNIDSVGIITAQSGIHVTGGNIGVNNTNPQSQLHVTNTSASTISLMEDGASGADLVYDGSTNYFSIKTGTGGAGSQTTRLTIQRDNGNIGIGTNIPTDKLHVYSSGANTISTIDSVGGDAGLQLRNSGDGNWSGINFIRERSSGTNVAGGSIWMPSVTANNSALLYIQTQTASANAGFDGVLTDDNGVRLKLATQPNGVAADSAFSVEVGSQERLRITSSGNIGIGTDDPSWGVSTGLIVGDGASAKGITLFSNSANVGDLAFADAISGTARYRGLIRYDHSDDSLAFRTNSTERLRIASDGVVTIPGHPIMEVYVVTSGSRSVSGNSASTLIPFNAANTYDPGNDMNVSTGVYTVPADGRYLLHYGTEGKTAANSNAGSIYYNINGGGISGQCLYYGDAYSGNSKQVILNLSAGDEIIWQIYGNNNQSYTINGANYGIYMIG